MIFTLGFLAMFWSRCITNNNNVSIESINMPQEFEPKFINSINNSIFVLGQKNSNTLLYKIDEKNKTAIKICEIENSRPFSTFSSGQELLFTGFNEHTKNSFYARMFNDSIKIVEFEKDVKVFKIFSDEGDLIKYYEGLNGWVKLSTSNDEGKSWNEITEIGKMVSVSDQIVIHNHCLYGYGSVDGFKDSDFFVFEYNLRTKKVNKRPFTDFKGTFDLIKIMDNKPVLITYDEKERMRIYDLSKKGAVVKDELISPDKSRIFDVHQSKDRTIIFTSESFTTDEVYSKTKTSAEWTLDISHQFSNVYTFTSNHLLGFDRHYNLIKVVWK